MGSSGSGKFNDYPGSQKEKGGPGGPNQGGQDDKCMKDLKDVALDEVGRSTYFRGHNNVPNAGASITLRPNTVGPRLSIDDQTGEDVGFLPTTYNYLLACMKKGFSYSGEVTSSSQRPVPSVRINLRASRT